MSDIREEIKDLTTLAEFLKLVPEKYTDILTMRCREDYWGDRLVFDVFFDFCEIEEDDRFVSIIKAAFKGTAFGNFCTFWNEGERERVERAINSLKEMVE